MRVIEILKKIKKSDVLISPRVRKKIENKELSVDEVLDKIFSFDDLKIEAKQNGSYELIYNYTGKYNLVVILFVNSNVRLATAWKSSKSMEKLIKKATHIYDYKRKIDLDNK